jgi:Leucine-rich repeat (LRR) protein
MSIIDKLNNDHLMDDDDVFLIENLDLRKSGLIKMPEKINLFKHLKFLNARSNQLVDISNITALPKLEHFMLYYNQLTTIPNEIVNLTKLKYINAVYNQIVDITENIGQLDDLETLALNYNQIKIIPDSVCNLTKLIELKLRHNEIKYIPMNLGNCIHLQHIDLTKNNIEEIPDISNLKFLQKLWLGENKIRIIPDNIVELTELQELILYDNQITRIPTDINKLNKLQKLYLHHNQITQLPSALGDLIWCIINVDNNPFEYIPPNVRRLLNLQEKNNIYDDNQNVHDKEIQKCVRTCIHNILNDETPKDDYIEQLIYSDLEVEIKEIIIEYCNDDTVHTSLNITFDDLFKYVWNRIIMHEDKNIMLDTLTDEIQSIVCKCFIGRISCLINTLNGYYDDVKIEISENEQLSAIITVMKKQYKGDNTDQLKEIIRAELKNRDISDDKIEEWLEHV